MSEAQEKSILDSYTQEELGLIREMAARDASEAELLKFLYVARARGLDPLLKQIYCIFRDEKRVRKMIIQTSVDGFRLIADRTGTYAPGEETWTVDKNGRPTLATVSVRKLVAGKWIKFSCTAHMTEYFVPRDEFWKNKPHTMLAKCAEVKAIRKGWPKDTGGLYIPEEVQRAKEEKDEEPRSRHAPQRAMPPSLPPVPDEVLELPWALMNAIEPLRKFTGVRLDAMSAQELVEVQMHIRAFEPKAKTSNGRAWAVAIWNAADAQLLKYDNPPEDEAIAEEIAHDGGEAPIARSNIGEMFRVNHAENTFVDDVAQQISSSEGLD